MDINYYISKCNEKRKHHYNQAKYANAWNTFFNILEIILSSSAALCLTIMTVYEHPQLETTIVSGSFIFLMTINSKIKNYFNFPALYYRHYNAGDDFRLLKHDFETVVNTNLVPHLVQKYILTDQKTHIEPVKCSKCFRKYNLFNSSSSMES